MADEVELTTKALDNAQQSFLSAALSLWRLLDEGRELNDDATQGAQVAFIHGGKLFKKAQADASLALEKENRRNSARGQGNATN